MNIKRPFNEGLFVYVTNARAGVLTEHDILAGLYSRRPAPFLYKRGLQIPIHFVPVPILIVPASPPST